MRPLFKGVATAMITPFTADGVDYAALEKQIEFQIANNVDALVVLGTTGEPATMTEKEKSDVLNFCIDKINGRTLVIAGTGSNCTKKAVEAGIAAEKAGADALLCVTPYYNKCTQNGLVAYYKEICSNTSLPVICYNVPPRTGVNILPETMEKIAEIDNIAGVKEACGNMEQICETARRIRGKAFVFSGDDNLNLPMLSIGACGVISVASNIIPDKLKEMTDAFFDGDLQLACKLHLDMLPVIDAMFYEVNPIPVKYAANLVGLDGGIPRAPLTELEDKNKQKMIAVLKEYGLKIKEV